MSHAVTPQHLEIFGLKQAWIANLDRVVPTFRQLPEKMIQNFHELTTPFPITGMEMGEFKDQRTNLIFVGFQRSQKVR